MLLSASNPMYCLIPDVERKDCRSNNVTCNPKNCLVQEVLLSRKFIVLLALWYLLTTAISEGKHVLYNVSTGQVEAPILTGG